MNRGWTVGKRLLQYERSSAPAPKKKKSAEPTLNTYARIAKQYLGDENGKVQDAEARDKVTKHVMLERSMQLTVQRVVA
jgi:hypothetical protein